MALSPSQERAVRAEAERRGLDPDEAVDRAGGVESESDGGATTGKPTFERLLIGAFPFIKVRELRANWLGLTERIADDEMTCGEFQAKYGGGAAPAPAATEPE